MDYFKVNPNSDQVKRGKSVLIANELITPNEAIKEKLSTDFLSKHCTLISLSKKKTYWFFGARFESKND